MVSLPETSADEMSPAKRLRLSPPPVVLPPFTFRVEDEGAWLAHYYEQGFCILRGVLDDTCLMSARQGCCKFVDQLADNLVSRGVVPDALRDQPFEKRLWQLCKDCPEEMPLLLRPELHKEEFFSLFCNQKLLQTVRKIVKAHELRIFPNYSLRPKTPSKQHDVVWHQDAGLRSDGMPSTMPVDERASAYGIDSCINVWVPLVSVTKANGAMKFIPGSQREGILSHEVAGSYADMTGLNFTGKHSIDKFGKYAAQVNAVDMERLETGAVDIECSAGDVVLFSQFMIHRGGTNTTDGIRWSFDFRFQDLAKPTLRELQGHVVHSEVDAEKAVRSAAAWEALELQ